MAHEVNDDVARKKELNMENGVPVDAEEEDEGETEDDDEEE